MHPVTTALLLVNVAVFVLQGVIGDELILEFALWPLGARSRHLAPNELGHFELWQLLTSSVLHGSPSHLFLNMFALWMFGRDVEQLLGSWRFLQLYLGSVLSAAVVQLAVVSYTAGPEPYPTIGASGGVFGVLLAFGALFPRRILILLFPPIPMPAWLFVLLYGLVELASGVTGTQSGIAHFAHLGGMLGAALVLARWRRQERRRA
ncbi:MAG: rhomboid family intramembrane serine protease [bacterium]|nr:rhomboid family intramembrane serine protease [bacterium]